MCQHKWVTFCLDVINAAVIRSTNKAPYKTVFGQKANIFQNVSMEVPFVNLSVLEDIVESQFQEDEVEQEGSVESTVSQRKRTHQLQICLLKLTEKDKNCHIFLSMTL